jgi:hypothetical protein
MIDQLQKKKTLRERPQIQECIDMWLADSGPAVKTFL